MRTEAVFSYPSTANGAKIGCLVDHKLYPEKTAVGRERVDPYRKDTWTSHGKSKSSYMATLVIFHNMKQVMTRATLNALMHRAACRVVPGHHTNLISFLKNELTNRGENLLLPTFTYISLLGQPTHLSTSTYYSAHRISVEGLRAKSGTKATEKQNYKEEQGPEEISTCIPSPCIFSQCQKSLV